MLKITTGTDLEEARMKLEGELAGTWVRELEESWQAMRATSAGKPTCLDLTGVTRVDEAGRYLLALIHVAGARMESTGIAMKDLLDSIGREWPVARIEGPGWAAVPPPRPQRR
jgi:ABC-type transporter Mla MlaB component